MSYSSSPHINTNNRKRRLNDGQEAPQGRDLLASPHNARLCQHLCGGPCSDSADCSHSPSPSPGQAGTTQCHSSHVCEDVREEGLGRTRIRAENEVEANKLVNNYRFGFRKWKSHVTERPFEDRSEAVKELYSELNVIKPSHLVSVGNIVYVFLFGWWVALVYLLVCILMFTTVIGTPYGKLCCRLSWYFLWPFGKTIQEVTHVSEPVRSPPSAQCLHIVLNTQIAAVKCLESCGTNQQLQTFKLQRRFTTYVWLLLGFPLLAVVHSLVCVLAWTMVFTIPVAKMNARTLGTILLMPPEDVSQGYGSKALLCCSNATNWHYYKYTVDGINVFAVNLLPLVIVAMVIGYMDTGNQYASSNLKFGIAVSSIIPLSYYIGMGIASISAQSNFAVGALVNATFGSITEMTFYITALIRGHKAGNPCLQEIVKAALTGTLFGCILFIPGISMVVGGLKHSEQRFNSRSTGVGSALLFISVGGVFAPTLFSKAYGNLVCDACTTSNNSTLFHNHVEPLVYSVCVLLPVAYIIGLIFTLKTHSHIYDIQVGEGHAEAPGGAVVHWSRWRSLLILIMATLLMSACADLATQHIQPILHQPNISQYFIGVTVIAMVPEIPEIVNGIQFALQNNINLSLEVGSCIAVQVCMLQIPLLVLFNALYDVGFVLIFSDLHLWASIFSVIVVNYILMDGKSDYFQGTALVVVYLILLALYFFAPSPLGC
uniref:Putative cation exchanger C521.04c n=1 Tax=Gadus morhua TaxID=8049 RepID=A0A8C5BTV2_GADMO